MSGRVKVWKESDGVWWLGRTNGRPLLPPDPGGTHVGQLRRVFDETGWSWSALHFDSQEDRVEFETKYGQRWE